MMLSKVDFPEPEGPAMAENSPAWKSRLTEVSAVTLAAPLAAE